MFVVLIFVTLSLILKKQDKIAFGISKTREIQQKSSGGYNSIGYILMRKILHIVPTNLCYIMC